MSNMLKLFQETSGFFGANADYIEDLYEQFLENPDSVEESWRSKFNELKVNGALIDIPHSPIIHRFSQIGKTSPDRLAAIKGITEESVLKQSSVARLINQYRVRGHEIANNNPIQPKKESIPGLDPAYYGLFEPDLDTIFDTGNLYGVNRLPLRKIISTLQEIYCGSVGTEYIHILDLEINRWIQTKLEGSRERFTVDNYQKEWLFKLLTAAEGIEKHLHRKYVGQKRFSLEGGESLILILDEIIQRAGKQGCKEIVLGMAHRGRLNVLINVLGKSPATLFEEFEGQHVRLPSASSGDVKYHMGFSSDVSTPGGPVHLALAFNPSHLEIINPVVQGSVKARQDRYGKNSFDHVIPVTIHGDAAFAGQGVVMETLNMSETRAYTTGGTIHIIINNLIGFTTSYPHDVRSTTYCSDIAKMIQAPVFHVNGDDPEAVLYVSQLALDYRMKFKRDVVIDLICYRRHGHNEADEPSVTQPMMYKAIRNHPSTRQIYADSLIQNNILSEQQIQEIEDDYQQMLESKESVSRAVTDPESSLALMWKKYHDKVWDSPCETSVSLETIRHCNEQLLKLPPEFELHSRVAKIMANRNKMAAGALPLDWGFAENMAYATLLIEQKNIRFTGQDTGRGTFFHRNAILYNQINGKSYVPLKNLAEQQGNMQIYDSLLSEAGVLGFEYGYSSSDPETLVIWEAQFGDFANGAQVVIDQFISSGEAKWGRLSGLVMLLPHGYEGQGPEHSSARLERYLQLCAEQNMQICNPTTPAQIFHLLRRQLLRVYRKPLIVMSPKSLLRHKMAVSTLEELTTGEFLPIIDEIDPIAKKQVTRVILCSGKIFYDLLEARRTNQLEHVVIIRVEQLYPFPIEQLNYLLSKYTRIKELVWCQEEPQNQGAWYQIRHRFLDMIGSNCDLVYAGRPQSASPAVGNFIAHVEQQKKVVEIALFG